MADNGLLPSETKPLPEPISTWGLVVSGIHSSAIHKKNTQDTMAKFMIQWIFIHLPRDNELNHTTHTEGS